MKNKGYSGDDYEGRNAMGIVVGIILILLGAVGIKYGITAVLMGLTAVMIGLGIKSSGD